MKLPRISGQKILNASGKADLKKFIFVAAITISITL